MKHVPICLLHFPVTQTNTRPSSTKLLCFSSPPPLSHTKPHADPNPRACLPAPTLCLEQSLGVLSQKPSPCIGGVPAGNIHTLGKEPELPLSCSSADRTTESRWLPSQWCQEEGRGSSSLGLTSAHGLLTSGMGTGTLQWCYK